jgi:hypothetical protein
MSSTSQNLKTSNRDRRSDAQEGVPTVVARAGRILGSVRGEDEHFRRLNEFLLYSGRGDVNMWAGFDGRAAAGAGYLR